MTWFILYTLLVFHGRIPRHLNEPVHSYHQPAQNGQPPAPIHGRFQ